MFWWQCQDCVFGTNSLKEAGKHMASTDHEVKPEGEDDDV